MWLFYSINFIQNLIEDRYFRNRQKVIECSDKGGCVAVVTGGGRGLGYHVVRGLVEKGMHVVVAVRNPERCKYMAELFRKEGLKGLSVFF